MLWKIDSTPHRILASIHCLPEETPFPIWTAGLLDEIRQIVFEADHRLPGAFCSGQDATKAHLSLPGASELYAYLREFFTKNGFLAPDDSDRPWFAALKTSGPLMARLGLKPECGVEFRLRDHAERNGLEVAFLEPHTLIADLLNNACLDPLVGLRFLKESLQDAESGYTLSGLSGMVMAWLRGDARVFSAIHEERMRRFSQIYDPLINTRNRHWLPVAQPLIHGTQPTLFVVGSLHTAGPDNFLELLARQGIRTSIAR